MLKRLFSCGLVLAALLSMPPALADESTPTDSNTQDFPTVVEGIWLNEEDLPWSTPVWVKAQDESKYLAVIDRDYNDAMDIEGVKEPGILTVWSPETLFAYGAVMHCSCVTMLFVPICKTHFHPILVSSVQLKVGNQIYRLQGKDSRFLVDKQVAQSLRQASLKNILIMVRIVVAGTGNRVTRPIGTETLRAWQTIYPAQKVSQKSDSLSETLVNISSSQGLLPKLPTLSNQSNLPTVSGEQWRSNQDLPWSVPVIIVDDFEGNYLAVLDRDSNEGFLVEELTGLVTNWGTQRLQIHPFRQKTQSYRPLSVSQITLQIGPQSVSLQGVDNEFLIDQDLAKLLYNAPLGEVSLSYKDAEDNVIVHPIGNRTIESWKILYQEASQVKSKTNSEPNLLPQKK